MAHDILIVDDEDDIRQLIAGILDDEGFETRQAGKWLVRAEALAELPKLRGGRWHPYRRLWANERKELPLQDVAAAGGWTDTKALALIYQKSDPETILRVVEAS